MYTALFLKQNPVFFLADEFSVVYSPKNGIGRQHRGRQWFEHLFLIELEQHRLRVLYIYRYVIQYLLFPPPP